MTKASTATTGANRPVRDRKTAIHYSDDNPNTFTVKRKKGQEVVDVENGLLLMPTPKKRRGRPPTKSTVAAATATAAAAAATKPLTQATTKTTAPTAPKRRRSLEPVSSPSRPRRRTQLVVLPSEPPVAVEMVAHAVATQPLVTWTTSTTTTTTGMNESHLVPQQQQAPQQPLLLLPIPSNPQPQRLFPNHVRISCFTTLCDSGGDHDHNTATTTAMVGTVHGTVEVWQFMPTAHIVRSYSTQASQREAERHWESKKIITYPNAILACQCSSSSSSSGGQKKQHPPQRRQTIAVLTHSELELLDAGSGTTLWIVPVSQPIHLSTVASATLQLEVNGTHVLWVTASSGPVPSTTTNNNNNNSSDDPPTGGGLYTVELNTAALRHVHEHVWTAVWDHHNPNNNNNNNNNNILAVMEQSNQVHLVRIDNSNNTQLPPEPINVVILSGTVTKAWRECHLLISGPYVVLTTAKGIRVHDATTLQYVYAYGEHVALHGKTVHWHHCSMVKLPQQQRANTITNSNSNNKLRYIAHEDELAHRQAVQSETARSSTTIVIGVPHPLKEPKELVSSLYVWQMGHVTPLAVLQAPKGGILSCWCGTDASGNLRIVLVTAELGQVWEWNASLKSDFAGTQYPVGYRITEDNLEYIEDEDELDQVVVMGEEGGGGDGSPAKLSAVSVETVDEEMDPDLAEALRLSILEQEKAQGKVEVVEKDPIISVLCDTDADDEYQDSAWRIPCRPELESDDETSSKSPSPSASPVRKSEETEFLFGMPQFKLARENYKHYQQQRDVADQRSDATTDGTAAMPQGGAAAKARGRRTKPANVEALLKSSIVPALRARMNLKMKRWADGTASLLTETASGPDPFLTAMELFSRAADANEAQPTRNVDAAESEDRTSTESAAPGIANGRGTDTSQRPAENGDWGCDAAGTSNGERGKLSPSIASRVSAEEKELAMELLLLSPGKASFGNGSDNCKPSFNDANSEADLGQSNAVRSSLEKVSEPVVTPPEQSPSLATRAALEQKSFDPVQNFSTQCTNCPACRGRMVLHSCGNREKPIDYEAIERAEREKKEKEEAEKLRLRVEKRRAAEAKRREARRLKKEEEERKRRDEEETMMRLEAGSFEEAHIREEGDNTANERFVSNNFLSTGGRDPFRPPLSPRAQHGGGEGSRASLSLSLEQAARASHVNLEDRHGFSESEYAKPDPAPTLTHGFRSSAYGEDFLSQTSRLHNANDEWNGHRYQEYGYEKQTEASAFQNRRPDDYRLQYARGQQSPVSTPRASYSPSERSTTIRTPSGELDVSELKPSTMLSATDALEALAGLANSLAAVEEPIHHYRGINSDGTERGTTRRLDDNEPQSHDELSRHHESSLDTDHDRGVSGCAADFSISNQSGITHTPVVEAISIIGTHRDESKP